MDCTNNASHSSVSPRVCYDREEAAVLPPQGGASPLEASASSSADPSHFFLAFDADADARMMCAGVAAALYAIFWLVRRYGPYVFTEAKSPVHRNKNDASDRLLTRIHDRWYDLTSFDHPGGPVALSLIHQRDGTALFESHHPFVERKKLRTVLKKYEVPSEEEDERGCASMDPRDDGGCYEWKKDAEEEDGFAKDLRELVVDHFAVLAKERGVSPTAAAKATPARLLLIATLMTSFFGTLPMFLRGSWLMLFLTPTLAWVTAVNYWHDGLHFALSTNWRINAFLPYLFPYFSSPWMWYHEHVIGHHAYPNIARKDPDLAHAPQLMREHGSIKWRPTHAGQSRRHRVLFVWSVALGMGLSLLNDAKANAKLSYNNVVPCASLSRPRMAAHVLGRMGYFAMMHVWPYFCFSFWKAIIWATVPGVLLSVCFMANTQINHLTSDCAHASDRNFYRHQAMTAQNFGTDSLFCYYFSGGLNFQIEHHLFPTVNHCHLPALSLGVKRICAKHGVPYQCAAGYRDAMERHVAHTLEMEKDPAATAKSE